MPMEDEGQPEGESLYSLRVARSRNLHIEIDGLIPMLIDRYDRRT